MICQETLNEFANHLKKDRFPNIVQDFSLVLNVDEDNVHYIYLELIKIKKSQQCRGYGSAVIDELLDLADTEQLEVRLYATNLYGSDLKRLYGFYRKHGFALIRNNNDGKFVYRPKKIRKY